MCLAQGHNPVRPVIMKMINSIEIAIVGFHISMLPYSTYLGHILFMRTLSTFWGLCKLI